jgi:hypothetical protein
VKGGFIPVGDDVNSIDWEEGHSGTQLSDKAEPILLDTVCLMQAMECQVRLNHASNAKHPSYDAALAEKLAASSLEDLSKDEMVEQAKHATTCLACSTALAQYQKIDELLGNLCSQEHGTDDAMFGLPPALLEAWKKEDKEALRSRSVFGITGVTHSFLSTLRKLLTVSVTLFLVLLPNYSVWLEKARLQRRQDRQDLYTE